MWFSTVNWVGIFSSELKSKLFSKELWKVFFKEFICFLSSAVLAHTQKNMTQHLYIEGFSMVLLTASVSFIHFRITLFSVVGSQPWGITSSPLLPILQKLKFLLGCLITEYEFCETHNDVAIYNISKSSHKIQALGISYVLWLFRPLLIPFLHQWTSQACSVCYAVWDILWSQSFSPVPALFLALFPPQYGLSAQHCAVFWNCAKPLNKHHILDWVQVWVLGWWFFKVLFKHCVWVARATEQFLHACKIIH